MQLASYGPPIVQSDVALNTQSRTNEEVLSLRSSMQVILTCIERDPAKAGFIWMLDHKKKAMIMLKKALAFEGSSRHAACILVEGAHGYPDY